MKTLGPLYTMRDTAKAIGNTDPRTVLQEVYRNGIPTAKVGSAIVINKAGLEKLILAYEAKRDLAKAS